MINLINNSEKVVPDLHESMNLNHFKVFFYCADFLDKEIKIAFRSLKEISKTAIIAWVARGMRVQECFLLERRQGIFFSIFLAALQPNSFSGCFWGLCFHIPLSSQATAPIKKSPQSNESQLHDRYIRVVGISGWFCLVKFPTWDNCQLCCTHCTIPGTSQMTYAQLLLTIITI